VRPLDEGCVGPARPGLVGADALFFRRLPGDAPENPGRIDACACMVVDGAPVWGIRARRGFPPAEDSRRPAVGRGAAVVRVMA